MSDQETQEEITEEIVTETSEEAEQDTPPAGEGVEDDIQPEDDNGEIVISFGDDEEPESEEDSETFRELRKKHREAQRELKALRKAQEPAQQELGPKPELENFDYDTEAYDAALLDWNAQKSEAEGKAKALQEKQEQEQERYQEKLGNYRKSIKGLGVKNFEDLEDTVKEDLSPMAQSVLIAHGENPAHLVYALAKNPKLRELFKGDDPVAMGVALGRLEAKMRVKSNSKPAPERLAKGGAAIPVGHEQKLAELEAEADRTGDRTALIRYKKQHKAQ